MKGINHFPFMFNHNNQNMSKVNFCPICGASLKGTESFCSKCGHRVSSYKMFPNSIRTPNSSFMLICAIIVIFGGLFIYFTYNKTRTSSSQSIFREISQSEIQNIKDVDKMRKVIDNTVWTHTEIGDLFWTKLEFKGNKVKIYSAMPSDGRWTFEEECPYSLEEGRFINDGRRYIAAVIKSKDMSAPPKFIITNGHLSWLGIIDAGGFVLGDYEWD